MIHYGKTPQGDLTINVTEETIGEVYDLLESANLLQRRTFDDLKQYVKREYADVLERRRRRMTAQIPITGEGGCHAVL